MNKNDRIEVVKTFMFDTLIGTILFIFIFGISIAVSELLHWATSKYINSQEALILATGIKYLILTSESVLYLKFLYLQTKYASNHMDRAYKE